MERPPNIPIFGTTQPKKLQKESTTEVTANAAVAIIEPLRSPPHPNTSNTGVNSSSNLGISPGKKLSFGENILISSRTSRNSGMMQP